MIYILVLLYGIWGMPVGGNEKALTIAYKDKATCEEARHLSWELPGYKLFLAVCLETELP